VACSKFQTHARGRQNENRLEAVNKRDQSWTPELRTCPHASPGRTGTRAEGGPNQSPARGRLSCPIGLGFVRSHRPARADSHAHVRSASRHVFGEIRSLTIRSDNRAQPAYAYSRPTWRRRGNGFEASLQAYSVRASRHTSTMETTMPYVTTKDGAEIYYKDWGSGPAIFFSHGWPLSADMWEQQMMFFASHGFRAIAHDRRGFGRSSQPWNGYDYDTFADDISLILETLDVHDVIMVGFSMGGGDVARYISRSRGQRVAKAVLTSAVTPLFIKTPDHSEGVDKSVFDWIRDGLIKDRPDFLDKFNALFYGTTHNPGAVSDAIFKQTLQIALAGSLKAT
jgi:non-heme chloroperoxidase